MTDTVNQRHWGARLKGDRKFCDTCGNDASSYVAVVDEDDVVTRIDWFCEAHKPKED